MAADENQPDNPDAVVEAVADAPPDEVLRRIGPSRWYCLARFLIHPFNLVAAVFWSFSHLSAPRVWLWHQLSLVPVAQDQLVAFFNWQHRLPIPLWLPFAALGFLHCLILWWSISYEMGDSALFIRSGPFTLHSPGGFFKIFDNPIYYSMILHVESSRGPLNLLFHTGTIIVQAADGNLRDHHLVLSHVGSPKKVVSALLDVAGGGRARILTTTR